MPETRYGIFTERQRKYLKGELTDLDPAVERAERSKIRRRIDTAFSEFTLLTKVSKDDREQIFKDRLVYNEDDDKVKGGIVEPGVMKRDKDEWESGGGLGLGVGLGHLLQFTYVGLREQGFSPDHIGTLIEYYISNAEMELGENLEYDDVQVTFDVETGEAVDLEATLEKYEQV